MRLPEYRLKLIPVDAKGKIKIFSKRWRNTEKPGDRFKIGGIPDFIQQDDTPNCSHCHRKMTFYAQLDAINEKYDIGDCGLIYVFFCFQCVDAKSIVQFY